MKIATTGTHRYAKNVKRQASKIKKTLSLSTVTIPENKTQETDHVRDFLNKICDGLPF